VADKQKPDKAMAGMLRRKRAWPPARPERSEGLLAGEACPDAGILAAYFERSLTASETSQWEAHFSSCARCQEQLAALVRTEPVSEAQSAPKKKPAFSWLWDWRLLAPVGAAVVVLAFFVSFKTMYAPIGSPAGGELTAKREAGSPAPAATEPQKPVHSTAAKTDAVAETVTTAKSLSPQSPAKSRSELDEFQRRNAAGAAHSARVLEELKDKAPLAPGAASGAVASAEPKLQARETQIVAAENRAMAAPPVAPVASGQAQIDAAQSQVQVAEGERAKVAVQDSTGPTNKQSSLKKENPSVARAPADSRFAANAGQLSMQRLRAAHEEFIVNTPNSKVLWRFGSDGLILHSRDAGKTWKGQESPSQESFLTASAPTENICWVGGSNGVLLRTTDGGEKWELIPSPAKVDIIMVKASDQFSVSVTAVGGRIYDTSDAGAHWRAR
jgi:hypothetical protein